MQIWLGVDLGTSALKATAINQDGQVIARAAAGYETHRPNAGLSKIHWIGYLR